MKKILDKNITITDVVLSMFVAPNTGERVHKDRGSHGLVLSVSGEKEYVFSTGERFVQKKGDFIYLPKHSNYVVNAKNGDEGGCYAFNFQIAEEIDEPPFSFRVAREEELLRLFRKSLHIFQKREEHGALLLKGVGYELLYQLCLEYQSNFPRAHAEKIRSAVEYIHAHYQKEKISVKTLARLLDMSETYFRKLFETQYKTTVVSYVNSLKTGYAHSLLKSGYSVSEAAELSGFGDLSVFSRTFKKYYGVSPSQI